MTEKSSRFFVVAALILITVAAFEPVRHNQFVFDDERYVVDNPNVTKGLTVESVVWAFTNSYASNYHPLTWLSHMLDCQLFGLKPLWHHVHNLILHCINVLLLFWILWKTTQRLWAAAFVAAVFAVHPLRIESVGWVAERKDVLSGLFWMLTVVAYIKYAEKPSVGRYLLVFFALLLGLLSKSMLVTLPFVLLLLDYWPLCRFGSAGEKKEHHRVSAVTLIIEKIPLIFLSVISGTVTFIIQRAGGSVAPSDKLPLSMRFANAFVSYISYITRTFYPKVLSVFYPHHLCTLNQAMPVLSLFILLIVSVIVVILMRKKPYLAVGWFWYLGTLIPVIGLVQVGYQAMADRYTYIPAIGLYLMFTWAVADMDVKLRARKVILSVLAAGILPALVVDTRAQLRYWKNNLMLYKHAIDVTENNWFMYNCYGSTLAKAGLFEQAIEQYKKSLQINPGRCDVSNDIAIAYKAVGKFPEAVRQYNKIILENPQYADAYYNLGNLYLDLGATARAEQNYRKALQISPDFPEAHCNLAKVLYQKGEIEEAIVHYKTAINHRPGWDLPENSLKKIQDRQEAERKLPERMEELKKSLQENPDQPEVLGEMALISVVRNDPQAAAEYWQKALSLKPDWVEAHNNLAVILEKQGKTEQAVDNWKKVLKLAPDNFTANVNLGTAYYGWQRPELAIECWTRAIETNPDSAETLNNLAWILATSKDAKLREPGRALEFAQRACQITKNTRPDFLDTLAVAYAANGNFEKAITVSKQAYALALIEGRDNITAQLQKHLNLFQSGTPYSE
jgi:tetratricopeptide (TPR) repeat protein